MINSTNNQFIFSPTSDLKVVDIDFLGKRKISGFTSDGIKSFQLFTKKNAKNSKFIPYRSDISGEVITFKVLDGYVFLPFDKLLKVRRLQLREIKVNPGKELNFDVLGCCEDCPVLTTLPPTINPTSTLPPSKFWVKVQELGRSPKVACPTNFEA